MPTTSEQWERVKEIFHGATEIEASAREAWLRAQCGDDEALRAKVTRLLRADEATTEFIERPAGTIPRDVLEAVAGDQFVSRRFGAYQTIREIGRGGLGTVSLAARADEKFEKEVAIKLLRRGLDTEDILRRFRNERQILAHLEHPNIARLLDAGETEEGLPYFVMEYVAGVPITDFCRDLNVRERLALFRVVCGAVAYAHQNLVLHRDLKPANVLVTADGMPKLLDFGIAKVLRESDELRTQTQPALRILTPEYASPEQLRGERMTTASDVFSLGVILYEVLAGHRPDHAQTRVTGGLPEKPSTVARARNAPNESGVAWKALRGDLDNIVLMAMRPEPERRYSSVAQLSSDVGRFLEGRPVQARADTWNYRTAKFVARHKAGVGGAVLLLLILLGGILATAREARIATMQARHAAEQRDRAERRFQDVRALSNALLFEIAPRIERLEGSTEAREALVRRALAYLDSLAQEAAGDARLQEELAAAYEKVGELQGAPRRSNLNDFPGAISSYGKARAIRERLLNESPNEPVRLSGFAANLRAASAVKWEAGDRTGALADANAAIRVYERLRQWQPNARDVRRAVAETKLELADLHYYNEHLQDAYVPLREAIAALEQLRAKEPDDRETLGLLLNGYTRLALTFSWDNRQAEGEAELQKALALGETLVAANPKDNVLRQALFHAYVEGGQLYQDADQPRAMELLGKGRVLAEEAMRVDSADVRARQNLAKVYSLLGSIASRAGQSREAEGYLQQAAAAFAELQRLNPRTVAYGHDVGRVQMYLGVAQQQQKKFGAALDSFGAAARLFGEEYRRDARSNFALRKLAAVYGSMGDVHRAMSAAASEPAAELRTAQENYARANELFGLLETRHALAEADRKDWQDLKAIMSEVR